MFMDNQNFIGMGRHNFVDSLFFFLIFFISVYGFVISWDVNS